MTMHELWYKAAADSHFVFIPKEEASVGSLGLVMPTVACPAYGIDQHDRKFIVFPAMVTDTVSQVGARKILVAQQITKKNDSLWIEINSRRKEHVLLANPEMWGTLIMGHAFGDAENNLMYTPL